MNQNLLKQIRKERFKCYQKSSGLQKCYLNDEIPPEKSFKLKKEQDKEFRKYKFYNNLLKAVEKQK